MVAKSQSSGPPSELNVFESSRGGGEVPKPTFARHSSCAGSAGLPYHLCPRVVGSYSFLPSRGGWGEPGAFPKARGRSRCSPRAASSSSSSPLQPFRPSWEPLARGCKSGQARPPSLPFPSLVKHSPGVLARSAWLLLPAASPPPPPFPRPGKPRPGSPGSARSRRSR